MAQSETAHPYDLPTGDLLQISVIHLPTWALEVASNPIRILAGKYLEAQRPILCDMLALQLPAAGVASVLDLTFETVKLRRRFDEITIDLIGPGGIENSLLVTETYSRRVMPGHSTLETDPCRQVA